MNQMAAGVIRMCPSDLGLPFRRKRRYTVFFRSNKIMFTGSYGGFVDLFFRRCELSGDIFFREGPGMADGDSNGMSADVFGAASRKD